MSADFREMTATLYRAVSAPPGERDWAAVRRIYHPNAYVDNVEALLADVRFREIEIGHEALIFGNVARLTSVYEFSWESPAGSRKGNELPET
jgi:hypothetical protein